MFACSQRVVNCSRHDYMCTEFVRAWFAWTEDGMSFVIVASIVLSLANIRISFSGEIHFYYPTSPSRNLGATVRVRLHRKRIWWRPRAQPNHMSSAAPPRIYRHVDNVSIGRADGVLRWATGLQAQPSVSDRE